MKPKKKFRPNPLNLNLLIRLAPAKPDASAQSGGRIPILHPTPPIGVTSLKNAEKLQDEILKLEKNLLQEGFRLIGGVDEVGRGCLAGPVFAAAVILPPHLLIPGVDDSKKLSPLTRERLFDVIRREAVSWSVASVGVEDIERLNIHGASLQAMSLAVQGLQPQPDFLLVDGRFSLPGLLQGFLRQRAVIGGDALSHSIAAASILAKVSRYRWMVELDNQYPAFHFAQHKGYGTEQHRKAILKNGLTVQHRKKFCRKISHSESSFL